MKQSLAWTEEDNLLLIHQVEKLGRRPARVKVGKHPLNSIRNQITKLRAKGQITKKFVKRTKPSEDFTTTEVRFIRQHTKEAVNGNRLSATQLALCPEMQRHTKESIATLVKNYGYADSVRSERIKLAYHLSKYEQRQVVKLLKGEGRFWPTANVADHFEFSVAQVRRLRRLNNLQIRHSEEAMQDPVYRQWYKTKTANRTKSINSSHGAFAKRSRLTRQKMAQARAADWSNGHENEKKRCLACGDYWPPTDKYFRTRKLKGTDGVEYIDLTCRCIACRVKAKLTYAS
jgi:hypothetical protein